MLVLVACEREIPYDGEYQDPKLVLEACLQEGLDYIEGTIIRSSLFTENERDKTIRWLDNKVVFSVQRDNGPEVSYSSDDAGYKKGNYDFRLTLSEPLRAGERIRVKASYPGFPSVVGEDVVVCKPEVSCVEEELDSVKFTYRYKIKFGENAGIKEGIIGIQAEFHYWTNAKKAKSNEQTTRFITSNNTCFAGMGNSFSSEYGYNGMFGLYCRLEDVRNKEVEIVMPLNRVTKVKTDLMDYIQLTVTNHSPESYRYRQSLVAYYGMQGYEDEGLEQIITDIFGIEEPVQVYGNVEDGIGIVYSQSPETFLRILSKEE